MPVIGSSKKSNIETYSQQVKNVVSIYGELINEENADFQSVTEEYDDQNMKIDENN